MKKFVTVLLAALLLLSLAGCAVPTKEAHELQLQPKGTYYLDGFGEEFIVYRFYAPNDKFVVYSDEEGNGFILCDDAGRTGTSYASVAGMEDYEFLAVSERYWLFQGEEGLIAIDFLSKTELGIEINVGDYCYPIYPFEELTEEEQNKFVYWYRRELVKNE